MDVVLNDMFSNIMKSVAKTKRSQQRHKKVFVDASGKQVAHVQLADVTSTYFQNQYQNSNRGLVVGQILGKDGTEISLNCFSDRPKVNTMFEQLFLHQFGNYQSNENLKSDFKAFLYFQLPFASFHRSYETYIPSSKSETYFKQLQVDFLSRVCMPLALYQYIENQSLDERLKIFKLILDIELRQKLTSIIPKKGYLLLEQFLKSREATFGSQLSDEIQMELQQYGMESFGDKDKCLLTFFYNIQKALGIGEEELYQSPTNIKNLSISKGVDRTQISTLFPQYDSLVSTERVKVAARRAITLFSSGLGKIAKGLKDSKLGDNSLASIKAGMTTIYNLQTKNNQTYEQDGHSIPFRFTPKKESAASALLFMYMEFMDYMMNPQPPLMLKADMKVQALYKNKEVYDLQNYNTWSSDKKLNYREEYLKFCAKYMNVGFTFTSKRGPHGMLLLNLDSWGEGEIVPNPFRVREDAILYKYFGAFRLQPNRLGIGQIARNIWFHHKIKYDYDPMYCDTFHEKRTFYPRPIFDINYFTTTFSFQKQEPRFSQLYCNVSSSIVENGPQKACAFRNHINQLSPSQYVKMHPENLQEYWEKQEDTTKKFAFHDEWFTFKTPTTLHISREANALLNIFNHWRNDKFDPTNVFANVKFQTNTAYQIVVPRYETGEGSKLNQPALIFWNVKESCYTFHNKNIPLTYLRPAPSLYNPFLHPLYNIYMNEEIGKQPPWIEASQPFDVPYFPYPIDNLNAENILAPIFPVCTRNYEEKKSKSPIFQQSIAKEHEIFPKSNEEQERWDLRLPLVCLLGDRAKSTVEDVIKAMKNHREIFLINDTNVLTTCKQNENKEVVLLTNESSLEEDVIDDSEEGCLDINQRQPSINDTFYRGFDLETKPEILNAIQSTFVESKDPFISAESEIVKSPKRSNSNEDDELDYKHNDEPRQSPSSSRKSPSLIRSPKPLSPVEFPMSLSAALDDALNITSPQRSPVGSTEQKNDSGKEQKSQDDDEKEEETQASFSQFFKPRPLSPQKISNTKCPFSKSLASGQVFRGSANKFFIVNANHYPDLPFTISVDPKHPSIAFKLMVNKLQSSNRIKFVFLVNEIGKSTLFSRAELQTKEVQDFIQMLDNLASKYKQCSYGLIRNLFPAVL